MAVYDMDGIELKVGDSIGWKNGTEQYGRIVKIGTDLVVKCWDSIVGDHYEERVNPRRAWKE
jgi:hypothetical protein